MLPDRCGLQDLVGVLREIRETDERLVELHIARLPRLSSSVLYRTCATLRGLRRAIRATDAAIGKLERIMEREQ